MMVKLKFDSNDVNDHVLAYLNKAEESLNQAIETFDNLDIPNEFYYKGDINTIKSKLKIEKDNFMQISKYIKKISALLNDDIKLNSKIINNIDEMKINDFDLNLSKSKTQINVDKVKPIVSNVSTATTTSATETKDFISSKVAINNYANNNQMNESSSIKYKGNNEAMTEAYNKLLSSNSDNKSYLNNLDLDDKRVSYNSSYENNIVKNQTNINYDSNQTAELDARNISITSNGSESNITVNNNSTAELNAKNINIISNESNPDISKNETNINLNTATIQSTSSQPTLTNNNQNLNLGASNISINSNGSTPSLGETSNNISFSSSNISNNNSEAKTEYQSVLNNLNND